MLRDFRIPYVMIVTSEIKSHLVDDLNQISLQITDAKRLGESNSERELNISYITKGLILGLIDKLESDICFLARDEKVIEEIVETLSNKLSASDYEKLKSLLLENKDEIANG